MPDLDNHAIAAILDTHAALLEISGSDKFRVLSFRRGANSLRAWPERASKLAEEGRLEEIPGVGSRIAVAIGSILSTGSFIEAERVKERYPASLVEVMKVPNVGPKRAASLHDELGVESVGDLEVALRDHGLDDLKGFGPRTAAKIATGLEAHGRNIGRVLLMDALPLARWVADGLRALPGVVAAEPAGSVRRMEETVGDVDVLVAADDPERVMSHIRELPMVAEVLSREESKTSVRTTAGARVGVRVVAPDEWGAALQYFTGSAEHNSRLRRVAKEGGLELSEHGVFRLEDGVRLGGATEDEVYALLGMGCPPPETRLDEGEIEAALEDRLPALLTPSDIRGDLHLHSTATDGRSTVEALRTQAAELGYEYIAVTDHAYALRMVGGLSVEEIARQRERIDALNSTPGPTVLHGIELNIADDGRVDYDDEVLAAFDICLASLHSGWEKDAARNTARAVRAMENPFIDCISHPTGRILLRRDPMPLDMEELFVKAGETGTLLEISAYPDRLDLDDGHIRRARRHGVRFHLATDAHDAVQMRFMDFGVSMARRGWCVAEEVLNTLPLSELRRTLKRARVLGGGG